MAVDLGIVDVPWWVLVGVVMLALALWWLTRDDDLGMEFPSDEDAARLAIPYYIERDGLGSLAASFKIELPRTREVIKQRKLVARLRGIGAERGQSETRQYAGEIDLPRLAGNLDEQLDYEACSRDVADVPRVEDRQVLADAIAHLDRSVPETSQTRELLRRVEEVYGTERSETVVKQKREELREVGDRQKLVLIRACSWRRRRSRGEARAVVLTQFETPRYYPGYGSDGSDEPKPMPVPNGVGIRVALPNESAFTPAGKERLGRGDPFYARIIAHSPSYNEDQGVLSCAAYAVWGTNRPRPRREY